MIEQIKKRMENGFRPFALSLSDGRRLAVPHRDFIAISSRTIIIIDKDELGVWINPLHVVSVEDLKSSELPGQSEAGH